MKNFWSNSQENVESNFWKNWKHLKYSWSSSLWKSFHKKTLQKFLIGFKTFDFFKELLKFPEFKYEFVESPEENLREIFKGIRRGIPEKKFEETKKEIVQKSHE